MHEMVKAAFGDNAMEKTQIFWVVLSIQTWGKFDLRFWAFRSFLDRSHRRKREECSQNHQRRQTKHHYVDCWQVRPLVWNKQSTF
jgi:hypothetical protein